MNQNPLESRIPLPSSSNSGGIGQAPEEINSLFSSHRNPVDSSQTEKDPQQAQINVHTNIFREVKITFLY